MTITLLALATMTAVNPFRAAAATPAQDRRAAAVAAVASTMLLILGTALAAGPIQRAVDITGSSARIAAGVSLVAVGMKDLLAAPPAAEPGLKDWRFGLIPLTFPIMFNPALALLTVAGSLNRGAPAMAGITIPAVALAGLAVAFPPRRGTCSLLRTIGLAGIGVGALVALDGIYAI